MDRLIENAPHGGDIRTTKEDLIYEARQPFAYFYFNRNALWLLVWIILFGWNVGLLYTWLQTLKWKTRITTQRVIVTEGIFSKAHEEVELYRVRDIELRESWLHRMFGIGTLTLDSDDATAPRLTIPVDSPQERRDEIREGIRKQRIEMRTFTTQ